MRGKKDREGLTVQPKPIASDNLLDWFKKNITDPGMIRWYVEQIQSDPVQQVNIKDSEN